MSHFWDKPKEIDYGLDKQFNIVTPKPPKEFLKDKEYIVFRKLLNIHGRPAIYLLSSFGRLLNKFPGTPEWLDTSSPDVAKNFQIDFQPLCFINQGWIELLEFLDNNLRLAPTIPGGGGYDTSSQVASGFLMFIPRLLSLYVQFFPDSVITETNNDPDVFFRNKQINPTLLKTFDELREQLQPSDEVIPEWRTHAQSLASQPVPEGKIKYGDFIQARESLRKMVKGGGKKKTKKKRSRRKTIRKKKSRKSGKPIKYRLSTFLL